jgi:hypothetical protein
MKMDAELPSAEVEGRMFTFGAVLATSRRLVWPRASIIAAFSAVMAIGVLCKPSARNCAVTTISANADESSVELAAAGVGG